MYKKDCGRTVGRHEHFSLVIVGADAGSDVLPDLWALRDAD
jgi:hypothetical protein